MTKKAPAMAPLAPGLDCRLGIRRYPVVRGAQQSAAVRQRPQ